MLIDLHTHAFPPAIAARTLASLSATAGVTPVGCGTRESVSAELSRVGADYAAILNIVTRPGQETTINNCAAADDARLSGRGRTLCFGSVHPASPHAVPEVHRIRALGLAGLKIHPDYQGHFIDDEAYFPIFEAAERLGLPVISHAGWDPLSPDVVHASAERAATVLRTFPRLVLVLAHFGGMCRYDEVERHLAGKFENLYFDTACSARYLDPEQARRIVHAQGAERILFGSDFPWSAMQTELDFVRSLGLSEEDERKILGENAARLLGVNQ